MIPRKYSSYFSVLDVVFKLGFRLLRLLPAEFAHNIGMVLLRKTPSHWLSLVGRASTEGLATKVPGIGELAHPIGLAAGFDKNGQAPNKLGRLGFSFLEVGTVTPEPQYGNPKPRLFRVHKHYGLVNRMGFNNDGACKIWERISAANNQNLKLGVNIGKNKDTPNDLALSDYVKLVKKFKDHCDYMVVNLSSPNTPGLRDLASLNFLETLAHETSGELNKIWLKFDPDMTDEKLQSIVKSSCELGFQGIILTNTRKVNWPIPGGESGHNLSLQATKALELAWEAHKGKMPMIAVGGIFTGADILERIKRGACAVQIYTAFAYHGPTVVRDMIEDLKREMHLQGFNQLEDAFASYYR